MGAMVEFAANGKHVGRLSGDAGLGFRVPESS